MQDYVHGYTARESDRLADQANTLTELLHHDTSYAPGDRVLEVGCGVGAQTIILAKRSPAAQFLSIDLSDDSLAKARSLIAAERIENVTFRRQDLFDIALALGKEIDELQARRTPHGARHHRQLREQSPFGFVVS